MTPSLSWTCSNFAKFNELYFNNELPAPKFRLAKASSYYGCFFFYLNKGVAKYRGVPYGTITMSTKFDRPEKDCLNTLLHEMVHAWQYHNDLPHGHGSDFKLKAEELNKYGWSIQRIGGEADDSAYIDFMNNTKVESHKEWDEHADDKSKARKVAALKRSISILEAKPRKSAGDLNKLECRKRELRAILG